MSSWRKDELKKIAHTDDLHISPFREDRVTYGTPTWIWSVVVDDSLYVRAYSGTVFALVQSRDAAEAWPDHRGRRDKERGIRTCRPTDQRCPRRRTRCKQEC